MAFPEFPPKVEFERGPVIDEGYSESEKAPYLSYSLFDEEGNILFYTDFPIEVSPEEISRVVGEAGKGLFLDPKEMVWKEAISLAERLIREAEKIPGLGGK